MVNHSTISNKNSKILKPNKHLFTQISKTIQKGKRQDVSQSKLISQLKELFQSIPQHLISNQDLLELGYLACKSCEICTSLKDDNKMLLCDYCDDAYHLYCIKPKIKEIPQGDWMCQNCQEQEKEYAIKKKERKSLMESQQKKQNCDKCLEEIQQNQSFNCINCKQKYHKECFYTEKQSQEFQSSHEINDIVKELGMNPQIVCGQCQIDIRKSISNQHIQIIQIIDNQCENSKKRKYKAKNKQVYQDMKQYDNDNSSEETRGISHSAFDDENSQTITFDQIQKFTTKNNKINKNISTQIKFLLPKPSSEPSVNLKSKVSLLIALKVKKMKFNDNLVYPFPSCTQDMNSSALEPYIQPISESNLIILQQFKRLSQNAQYIPLVLEEDLLQGYLVKNIEFVKQNTLICEYAGDVDILANRIFDDNDSIMTLLKTPRSKTSLVICPTYNANLARFISGINNKKKGKANLASIRFDIEGKVRIFLYAKTNIEPNQILCYDYNAGGFDEYPTENFI